MTHYESGIHSNIPECCVKAYCRDIADGIEMVGLHRKSQVDRTFEEDFVFSYVPCVDCWDKYKKGLLKPNAIHRCSEVCGPLNCRDLNIEITL